MFVNIFIYACIYTLTEHLTRTVAKYNMVSAPGWCPIKISVGVLKAETVEKGFWALIGRLFLGWQDMDCTWFVRNNLQVLPSSAWWFFPTKIFTFHMFAVNKRGSDLRVEPFWFGFFDHFMMHCSTGSAALCVCVVFCCCDPLWGNTKNPPWDTCFIHFPLRRVLRPRIAKIGSLCCF